MHRGRCPVCSRPLPVHGRCYWCAQASRSREVSGSTVSDLWELVRSHALPEESPTNRIELVGRAGLFLLLVGLTWSWSMQPLDGSSRLSQSIFQTVLSLANLVFHEAGHVIFMFFQLIAPAGRVDLEGALLCLSLNEGSVSLRR